MLSPHLPIDIQFLKGFLIFQGKKPITLENKGRGGGGFFMGSRLPNHDVKGWKEWKKKKKRNKNKNKKEQKTKQKEQKTKKHKGRLHQTWLESKHNRKYQSI